MGNESKEVIVLGAWFSPYSHMVKWALELKGIKYQFVEEDINNKSPLLLKHNPIFKKIPVLVHGGKAIVDSFIIIQYIDETWKQNPIMPLDPYERAMSLFWAHFIEDKLHKSIKRAKAFKGEKKEQALKEATSALETLEQKLIKLPNKFFRGDTIGYLDIALGWATVWLEAFEELCCVQIFESDKYPKLHKWRLDFQDLPMVNKNLPQKDKLVKVLENYGLCPLATTMK